MPGLQQPCCLTKWDPRARGDMHDHAAKRCQYPTSLLHIRRHSNAQVQSKNVQLSCSFSTAHMVDGARLCVGQRALAQAGAARLPQRVPARQWGRLHLVAGAGGVPLRVAVPRRLPGHVDRRTLPAARNSDGASCSALVL